MEEHPAQQHVAGFWPFTRQVKSAWRYQQRHSRESGNPCEQKTLVLHMFTMDSRLRGNGAAAELQALVSAPTAGFRISHTLCTFWCRSGFAFKRQAPTGERTGF
jgi:hypothetical protein